MNIGIFGVGNFGETHIKVLRNIKHFNIIGFCDPNQKRSQEIEKKFNITAYTNPIILIKQCDAIDIVSETGSHFKLIQNAIKYNKHIFIEKPVCANELEVSELLKITSNYTPTIQVGHIERYNPAIKEGFKEIKHIKSIKTTRTGYLNDRNQNTSISLDLMIHDIDLVLSIIKSPIINIAAIGRKAQNGIHNYIECTLEFQNRSKAVLTTERNCDINSERKMTIICINKIVEIDLLNRTTKIIDKNINKMWESEKHINPLHNELIDFYSNIKNKQKPLVGIQESCDAVQTALEIEKILNCQK